MTKGKNGRVMGEVRPSQLRHIQVRDEFVSLNGDTVRAILLEAAMLAWPRPVFEDEIENDALLTYPATTIRRHLRALVKQGFVHDVGYERTAYRADLVAISRALVERGYEITTYLYYRVPEHARAGRGT
ncbi:MAG: hypothetical protein M3P49_07710 [Actinomycetota bacterium]|nr:hypothetical protein [Actinomycetota bacterium]